MKGREGTRAGRKREGRGKEGGRRKEDRERGQGEEGREGEGRGRERRRKEGEGRRAGKGREGRRRERKGGKGGTEVKGGGEERREGKVVLFGRVLWPTRLDGRTDHEVDRRVGQHRDVKVSSCCHCPEDSKCVWVLRVFNIYFQLLVESFCFLFFVFRFQF